MFSMHPHYHHPQPLERLEVNWPQTRNWKLGQWYHPCLTHYECFHEGCTMF